MYDELVKRLKYKAGWDESGDLEQAADAIEALSKLALDEHNRAAVTAWEHRWIPVSERLPGKTGHYIVFVELKCDGQRISAWTQVTWFFGEFILECPEDEKCFVATVTHWMPLPQPPKEG